MDCQLRPYDIKSFLEWISYTWQHLQAASRSVARKKPCHRSHQCNGKLSRKLQHVMGTGAPFVVANGRLSAEH